MKCILEVLGENHRNSAIIRYVDMYWYIQKHKEVEILTNRLKSAASIPLRNYFVQVCALVSERLEHDERFIDNQIGGANAKMSRTGNQA